MIVRVGMIILLEHDLDAAVDFYKKLGLKPVFHIKESWAEFAIGEIKIGLCPTSRKPQERITGIVLEVNELHGMYRMLKDSVPFKTEPIEKVHGIIASIQDPSGNIIDLYQPTPNKVQELVKEVVQAEEGDTMKKHCSAADCQCEQHDADA